jgi:hypothetical protein
MTAGEQGVGVDVALFVVGGVQVTSDAFVEFGGLLKGGHATQRQRSTDREHPFRPGERMRGMSGLLLSLSVTLWLPPQQPPRAHGVLHTVRNPKWVALSKNSLAYPPSARYAVLSRVQRQHLFAWPAGSQIGFQTREETWSGLVLSGSLTLYSDGLAGPVKLGPWTYFEIPAGVSHKLGCDPAALCVVQTDFADPLNEVAALTSKEALDPNQTAPFLLPLKQNMTPLGKQKSNGRPVAMSRAFFWGVGFASLVRYPNGQGQPIVNSEFVQLWSGIRGRFDD